MVTPRTPNQKKRYASLNERLAKYTILVQEIYDTMAREGIKIASSTSYEPEKGTFKFSNFSETKHRLDELLHEFSTSMQTIIHSSTTDEWKQSNLVQDLTAKQVWSKYKGERIGKKYETFFQTNSDALKAFQNRKQNGLNLSQRIWKQTENLQSELEDSISVAIQKGFSATTLSKQVSKYLHDYPKLAKDYKATFGKAINCNDCEYRSIRLARTEISMAYRNAEQLRWQQMDFVLGYEIKISDSHPKHDICDELQGQYPKDFVFPGWHPCCLCYTVPIIASDEDYWNGKIEPIINYPNNFKQWITKNEERIVDFRKKGNEPYFIRQNTFDIDRILKSEDGIDRII